VLEDARFAMACIVVDLIMRFTLVQTDEFDSYYSEADSASFSKTSTEQLLV